MLLHLLSLLTFSVPITTHILKLSLDEQFKINGYPFDNFDSTLLIVVILAIISANIYSIMTDRGHKMSLLITGSFLLAVTMIQIVVIIFDVPMEVFGHMWDENISIIESSITGTFALLLLLTVAFMKNESILPKAKLTSRKSFFSRIQGAMEKLFDRINQMDRKLAFLLGLVCSLILAIPICGVMYLVAITFLGLDELFLDPKRIKFLAWLGIVGMQGSSISMFLGLRKFDRLNKLDSLSLFLNSLVRPYIGLAFAHLSFFMLESGLLLGGLADEIDMAKEIGKAGTSGNKMLYSFEYHVSIAFIAGFTERIAKVIQPGEKNINETGSNASDLEKP